MDIELLQYFQTKTDIQISIEQEHLKINIGELGDVNCTFWYEYKEIGNLIEKLNIESFKFCSDIEINENILNLLEKIKKFTVYIENENYSNKFKPILEKYPNIQVIIDKSSFIPFKTDCTKVFGILSKYDGLKVNISYSQTWGYAPDKTPKFQIRGRNKEENVAFDLPLFDDKLLETLTYDSFEIISHGKDMLNYSSRTCKHLHRNEVKNYENNQLCKECKEKYDIIIRRYSSLFELMHKVKTKKRMLKLFSDELKGKNLAAVDEIYIDDFSEKTKESVESVLKSGFRGVLSYYAKIGEIQLDLKEFDNLPIKFVNKYNNK